MSERTGSSARPPAWRQWLRRMMPWLITGGVVTFLLYRYPFAAIRAEVVRGDVLAIVPFVVLAVASSLLFVSAGDWLVIRASLGRTRYLTVLSGKAGTSMLLALGYAFGHGGYGLWLARKTGAGVRRTVGMISYLMISDLTALCVIASAAVWLGGDALEPRTRLVFSIIAPAAAVGLSAICLLGPRILGGRFGSRLITEPWAAVPAPVFVASVALRMANLAVAMGSIYLAARAFGLALPFSATMIYLPLIFMAGTLPLNIAGFGAVQLVWVELFSPWASGEQILAFQFLFQMMLTALLVVRGLPFIHRVVREIDAGSRGSAPKAVGEGT